MKTDSLFYRLFQLAPSIFFELIGEPASTANNYEFRSIEIKQTAFRIDGVLLPIDTTSDNPGAASQRPVYFAEVQFQKDQQLYHRFFAELFLYLNLNPNTYDWQGVLIYPSRSTEPDEAHLHQILLDSPKMRRIYLNELPAVPELPLGVAVAKLVIEPEETAAEQARQLIQRSQQESVPEASRQAIVDLVETIIMYKFTSLTWEEIQAMLGLDDLRKSRAYQQAVEEGRQEGLQEGRQEGLQEGRQEGRQEGQEEAKREIVENLLKARFGKVDERLSEVAKAFLAMPSTEFTPLLIQLSREELIDRFGQNPN